MSYTAEQVDEALRFEKACLGTKRKLLFRELGWTQRRGWTMVRLYAEVLGRKLAATKRPNVWRQRLEEKRAAAEAKADILAKDTAMSNAHLLRFGRCKCGALYNDESRQCIDCPLSRDGRSEIYSRRRALAHTWSPAGIKG